MIGECVFGIVKCLVERSTMPAKNCVFQKHRTFNVISQHQPFGLSMKFETQDGKKKQNSKQKTIIERNQTRDIKQRAQARNVHIKYQMEEKIEKINESNANVNSEQSTFWINVAFAIWCTIVFEPIHRNTSNSEPL